MRPNMSWPLTSKRPTSAGDSDRYRALIAREAAVAGQPDRRNPQLWDDAQLFELTLARVYRHLVARAVAVGGPALELGCGDGDLAFDLAGHGLDVTGVDLS